MPVEKRKRGRPRASAVFSEEEKAQKIEPIVAAPFKRSTGRKKDVDKFKEKYGIDFDSMTGALVAAALNVRPETVSGWACPRNPDGSYSLPAVVMWREEKIRAEYTDMVRLQQEKIMKDIELKDAQILKTKNEFIPRAEHEQILIERGVAFRQLWEQSVRKYVNDFVGQPREALLVHFDKFGRAIAQAFTGGGKV